MALTAVSQTLVRPAELFLPAGLAVQLPVAAAAVKVEPAGDLLLPAGLAVQMLREVDCQVLEEVYCFKAALAARL